MRTKIEKSGLKVGQWIKFSTETQPSFLTDNEKKIYHKNRIFLVITREDATFDLCRCYLIDDQGKTHDYCYSMGRLGYVSLINNTKIEVLPKEEVEAAYGYETMLFVYNATNAYLQERENYFSKYDVDVINIDHALGEKDEMITASRVSSSGQI